MTKGPMYAAAGIAEYWLVNLREGGVEVYRQPNREQRRYTTSQVRRAGDHLEAVALPGVSMAVAEILPPV